ncbi:exodeoxyribonuclease V subunit beta [Mesonia sp. HuA40]|uniref:UvrD-helicase domain-containing protein n=1 Tax=Mesonia sp. HuA40 TaxID=2602761 RepID=UPI0011C8EE40|nr:UvrD-helicase domain-containing protein [Mesonia sp. HuA40]TXK72638.1 AAA family ATPase [Mesonia sp. HuA40]
MSTQQKQPSFIIYNASAGSGKTFTMVKEYLQLVLQAPKPDYYKHILAITFTNKAVSELKSRVLHALIDFSQEDTPKNSRALFEAVAESVQLEPQVIRKKSKAIVNHILHNYAAFEISTIDGFTHRLLRTFAKDLDINVNFEVELDSELVIEEAVDRVINKAGSQPQITQALINFVLKKADDDKSWDIRRDLTKMAKLLLAEDNFAYLDLLTEYELKDFNVFYNQLKSAESELMEQNKRHAEAFFELLEQNQIPEKCFNRGSVPDFFRKNLNGDLPKVSGAVWHEKIADNTLYTKSKTSNEEQAKIDAIQPQIAELFYAIRENYYQLKFYAGLAKNVDAQSLLFAIQNEIDLIKEERDMLLMVDFNRKISEEVKNQPAPFIYERLGERYHNFFIDEFQDTSALQWENLQPLINNSLSGFNTENKTGNLFLVGDAKQSIYRWRGGKAEQFINLYEGHSPFSITGKTLNLPANYRSYKEIIDFNNRFFTFLSDCFAFETYRNLYAQAEQKKVKNAQGYVQLDFIEGKNSEEQSLAYAAKTVKIIQELKEEGTPLSDICLLTRKNKHGILLANHLVEAGIPVISSDALLLSKSKTVNFVQQIFELSLRPEDKEIRYELLYFLSQQITIQEEELAFYKKRLSLSIESFFDSLQVYGFHFSLQQFQKLPLYEAAEYVIRSFKIVEKADAYLQYYLDFVYEFTQKSHAGLMQLVEVWNKKKDKLSIVAAQGVEAVQILSVHKSKGLEFPVVIYPFAQQKLDDFSRDSLWALIEDFELPLGYLSVNKETPHYSKKLKEDFNVLAQHKLLDEINVLYVALTRAKEQLYIISKIETSKTAQLEENTFGVLFQRFLEKQNKWEADVRHYHWGHKPKPNAIEDKKGVMQDFSFISTAPENHQAALMTKNASMWLTSQEEAIAYGDMVHEILSQIITVEDIQPALANAVEQGDLNQKEALDYEQSFTKMVNHPELNSYFTKAYTVYTEKELLVDHAYMRLDRLCLKNKEAVIIDYKTGSYSPDHKIQLNEYAEAIKKLGYTVKKGVLIYLENRQNIKIVYL